MKQSAKSVRARLLNISIHENINIQLIIIRYFQERLLYRLSKSVYNNTFCLKGGVLLYLFEEQKSRPTMDIDFLAINTKNEIENLKTIFSEICQIHSDEDAVNLTFKTRNTIVSEKHSLFENDFYMEMNSLLQWKAFKQKAKISDIIEFVTVMQTIIIELEPIYKRMIKQKH